MYKRSTTFALNILNLTDDTHLLNCHELPIVLNICIIYLSVVGYFREYNKKFMFWFNSFNTEHLLKLTSFFQNHDLYRVKWHENIGYSCLCTLKRVVHESNSLTCVKCMTHINYNGSKRDLIQNSFESRFLMTSCRIGVKKNILRISWFIIFLF